MSGVWPTSVFTSEFRREYEAEREQWLRRRFLWYTGVVGGVNVLVFVAGMVTWLWLSRSSAAAEGPKTPGSWVTWLSDGLLAAVFLLALRYALRHPLRRDAVLSLAFWLIVISGGIRLALGAVALERALASTDAAVMSGVAVGFGSAFALLGSHLFACLFLPWTPRESFRPLIPLLVLNALLSIWYSQSVALTALVIAGSPLIGAPGALVCWWRFSRFHDRFSVNMLRRRYTELKRDLVNARQIHESMFAGPVTSGEVRLAYRYEPMRQIGGDYLYSCMTPRPGGGRALNFALIDVTGHGVPAALTVNRLHGELERIFAEDPMSSPGDVLRLLNRYVHLTLATHSVYATAFCARIIPDENLLEYASGGHPPAFLRAVDGKVERLDSTTFVLGVAAGDDFVPGLQSMHFGRGDVLIAYTDGALEVQDRGGRNLGIAGLQKLIACERAPEGGWSQLVLDLVDRHRYGGAADDTLVVEVWRPLSGTVAASASALSAVSNAPSAEQREPEAAAAKS
jgi:hypothetical protein